MKLKYLFGILAALLLGMWGFMFTLPFAENAVTFYILEGATALTLAYIIFFYCKVMRPFDTLAGGLDMLRAQDWNSRLRCVGQPETDSIATLFNDLLDRLMQQRIRYEEQTHFLHELSNALPVGVTVTDDRGRIVMANPAAEEFLGPVAAIEGRRFTDMPGELARAAATLPDNCTAMIRTDGMITGCRRRHFIRAGMTYNLYIFENLTNTVSDSERRGYEKVIRVMAHEVNNTVAGITSALDTIGTIAPDGDTRELTEACAQRSRNLSAFISRYADVVRIPAAELRSVSIADLLGHASAFMESIASREGVEFHMETDESLPPVKADPALLEQVLVNIVKNAVESAAMNGDGGQTGVTCHRCERKVTLTVYDNGPGISPDKAEKLFTPFFTDKPEGNGIGLMMAREVLRQHGCRFSLTTDPDDGITRFTIHFP